jgi:hypothetical protein
MHRLEARNGPHGQNQVLWLQNRENRWYASETGLIWRLFAVYPAIRDAAKSLKPLKQHGEDKTDNTVKPQIRHRREHKQTPLWPLPYGRLSENGFAGYRNAHRRATGATGFTWPQLPRDLQAMKVTRTTE